MDIIPINGVIFHLCNNRFIGKHGANRLHYCQEFANRISNGNSQERRIPTALATLLNKYERRLREHENYASVSDSVKETVMQRNFSALRDFENMICSYFITADVPRLHDDWVMMMLLVTADLVDEFIEQTNVDRAVQYTRLLNSKITQWSRGYYFYGPELFRHWMEIPNKILNPARELSLTPDMLSLKLPGIPGPPLTSTRPYFIQTVLTTAGPHISNKTKQEEMYNLKYTTASVFITFILKRTHGKVRNKLFEELLGQCRKINKCRNEKLMSIMEQLGDRIASENIYQYLQLRISAIVGRKKTTHTKAKTLVTILAEFILPQNPPFPEDLLMTCCLLTYHQIVCAIQYSKVDEGAYLLRRVLEGIFLLEQNVEAISTALSSIEANSTQVLKNTSYKFTRIIENLESKIEVFSQRRNMDKLQARQQTSKVPPKMQTITSKVSRNINQQKPLQELSGNTIQPPKKTKLRTNKEITLSATSQHKTVPKTVGELTPTHFLNANQQRSGVGNFPSTGQFISAENRGLHSMPDSVSTEHTRTDTASIASSNQPGVMFYTTLSEHVPFSNLLQKKDQCEKFEQHKTKNQPANERKIEYNNSNPLAYSYQESRLPESTSRQNHRRSQQKAELFFQNSVNVQPTLNAYSRSKEYNIEKENVECGKASELSTVDSFSVLNIPEQPSENFDDMNYKPSFNVENLQYQLQKQQVVPTETRKLTHNTGHPFQDLPTQMMNKRKNENITDLFQQQKFTPENACEQFPNVVDFATIFGSPDEFSGQAHEQQSIANTANFLEKPQFLSGNFSAKPVDFLPQAITTLDDVDFSELFEEMNE